MDGESKSTGWAWLDSLGSNVGQVANAWLTAELVKFAQPSSTPAVASVPNQSPTPVANSTTAGLTDPNAWQRYGLWAAIGIGVIIAGAVAYKALK